MDKPKEDPQAAADRERERRRSRNERVSAARDNAQSMTTDYASVYGRPSIMRMGS